MRYVFLLQMRVQHRAQQQPRHSTTIPITTDQTHHEPSQLNIA
jgi:hypothetical protein